MKRMKEEKKKQYPIDFVLFWVDPANEQWQKEKAEYRAKQLHEYINLINKLDYIERHIHLKKNAVNTTEWVVNARTWHRNQAKDHLLKLEFFSGLISTYKPDHTLAEPDGFSIESGPVITRDHVDDVIDNKLYWPQA